MITAQITDPSTNAIRISVTMCIVSITCMQRIIIITSMRRRFLDAMVIILNLELWVDPLIGRDVTRIITKCRALQVVLLVVLCT